MPFTCTHHGAGLPRGQQGLGVPSSIAALILTFSITVTGLISDVWPLLKFSRWINEIPSSCHHSVDDGNELEFGS